MELHCIEWTLNFSFGPEIDFLGPTNLVCFFLFKKKVWAILRPKQNVHEKDKTEDRPSPSPLSHSLSVPRQPTSPLCFPFSSNAKLTQVVSIIPSSEPSLQAHDPEVVYHVGVRGPVCIQLYYLFASTNLENAWITGGYNPALL
jgi:hypothetical protein